MVRLLSGYRVNQAMTQLAEWKRGLNRPCRTSYLLLLTVPGRDWRRYAPANNNLWEDPDLYTPTSEEWPSKPQFFY